MRPTGLETITYRAIFLGSSKILIIDIDDIVYSSHGKTPKSEKISLVTLTYFGNFKPQQKAENSVYIYLSYYYLGSFQICMRKYTSPSQALSS